MITVFQFIVIGVISLISFYLDTTSPYESLESATNLNTTIVILNWSRPFNVNKIVSEICPNLFEDVVHSIVIWNNNPKPMSFENSFSNTSCPESRVRIINSPENLYFQARYMACAEATTPYCFIQDDDYLILPEIIRALVYRISDPSSLAPSIHLQPAHEMLSSELRMIALDQTVHMTFAWLGYGTVIKRSRAVEFLALLGKLHLSDDQHKMADNYFTILSNEVPERWFDAGIELGSGQAFTVGAEGEERNNRHIIQATKILESIQNTDGVVEKNLPYVDFRKHSLGPPTTSRAPCHGRLCVFETSIKLIADNVYNVSAASASDILELEKRRLVELGERTVSNYLRFPPSNAVDGIRDTVFRSAENGKFGEWIMLDLTHCRAYDRLQLVLEVDEQMEAAILHGSVSESSKDGVSWYEWKQLVNCSDVADVSSSKTLRLLSCSISADNVHARYLRVRLLADVDYKWGVYEMYARDTNVLP